MMYLVKLVVASMCLAQVTDAASIRKNRKATALSQLDERAALQSLASRYNCSDSSESLVQTLNRVTLENEAANKSLVQSCQEAEADIAAHLAEMLAEADKMETVDAPAAGQAVYDAAMKIADEAFGKVDTTHTDLVTAANTAAEEAKVKMEEAFDLREEAVKAKTEAEDVYQALLVELEENLKAHTETLDQTRSIVIEEAKKTLDQELETAEKTKEASFTTCQSTYDARMALITKDEETIEKEIKPLLEQLMDCDGTSFLEMSSVNKNAHHSNVQVKKGAHGRTRGGNKAKVDNNAKCSAVKRELKAKMLLLETSSMRASAAETPVQEVTGNVDEWTKRVADEKTEAAAVLKTCQDEATGILAETTEKLNAVYQAAETEADKLHSESLEKFTAEQAEQKKAGEAARDATLEPASKAEADYNSAKMTSDEKDAAHEAALTAQEDALAKAHEAHATAETLAREAQLIAEKPIKEDAETLRAVSQEDAAQKTANKKAECSSEMASLQADLDIIALIKEKMSTLTTVDTDVLGAKAEEEAAASDEDTTSTGLAADDTSAPVPAADDTSAPVPATIDEPPATIDEPGAATVDTSEPVPFTSDGPASPSVPATVDEPASPSVPATVDEPEPAEIEPPTAASAP